MILRICRVCGARLSDYVIRDSDALSDEGFGPAWFFCCSCARRTAGEPDLDAGFGEPDLPGEPVP